MLLPLVVCVARVTMKNGINEIKTKSSSGPGLLSSHLQQLKLCRQNRGIGKNKNKSMTGTAKSGDKKH